jgi:hypothetical protein
VTIQKYTLVCQPTTTVPIHVDAEELGVKREKKDRNKARNTKKQNRKRRGSKERKGFLRIYSELKQQIG